AVRDAAQPELVLAERRQRAPRVRFALQGLLRQLGGLLVEPVPHARVRDGRQQLAALREEPLGLRARRREGLLVALQVARRAQRRQALERLRVGRERLLGGGDGLGVVLERDQQLGV